MSQQVFLSGPMGSGKSAVCARLGQLLGLDALDLDTMIERRAGVSVADLFKTRGEAAFRELERALITELVEAKRPCVVALGGGTVTDRTVRRRLLGAGVLVTLGASLDTLAERVGKGAGRPLLTGASVRERLAEILEARADAYAECHAELKTDGRSVDDIAREAAAVVAAPPIVVPLGIRTYRVEVGPGVRARLALRSAEATPRGKIVLVTDTGACDPWAREAAAALRAAGRSVTEVVLPAGEANKHLGSVERIWDAALDAGVDREALVIAVGGGVVGDMAAFAASTVLRGVAFGQLPTTLLSMVDSAVGGKTGIDRPQGKNLIGSFHQPAFVLCDVESLTTLPVEERRAGLAEVVKSAWLDGEAAVAALERDAGALAAGEVEATTRAIRMAISLKARIVSEDEREGGVRALLNLGHTVGHAIEAASGYTALRHGEAVSLGLVAAFRVAQVLGSATPQMSARMVELLARLGLPTDVRAHLSDRALSFLGADKKRVGAKVRFVLPSAPGDTSLTPLAVEELAKLMRDFASERSEI